MKRRILCFLVGFGALPLSALAFPFEFFEPVQPPRPAQVMEHRGAAGQAPENTRPALLRCIEEGFEWAEIDVRLSRDGHHVLWHDVTLNRLGIEKQVKDLTLAELEEVDAGAWYAPRFKGERLLTLRQALDLARGKLNLYLDCKDVDFALLAREVLEARMERQVVVYDRPGELSTLRSLSQDRIAVMTKWHPADGMDGWVQSLKPDAVEMDAPEITPLAVRSFHQLGIKVEAKTLGAWDKPELWDGVIGAGVDWLQTDLAEEVISRLFEQRMGRRATQVAFHRGAKLYAPENTLPAFAKAGRLGADYIEFDVQTTRDGRFYLLHDEVLDRTTTGRGPIAEAMAEQVARLDAGAWFGRQFSGVPIPSLDEFLDAVPERVQLYLDAKAIPPDALSTFVEKHHLAERTIVYQSPGFLKTLKAINPRIRILPPLRRPEDIEALAAELKPYAVDADWAILSKELIDRCHARGIKVFSDALGPNERIERYQQAMEWGLDLIQTDHPLRVYRAMELRAGSAVAAPK